MRLWMRFMTLGNPLCTTALRFRIPISLEQLANQKTLVSGDIPWDPKLGITYNCRAGIRVTKTKSKILLEVTGEHDIVHRQAIVCVL
jgi:hypothetical protein